MARLKKSFDAVVAACENETQIRLAEEEEWRANRHQRMNRQVRMVPKPESEVQMIKDLLDFIDQFFANDHKERMEREIEKKQRKKAGLKMPEEEFKI